MDWIKVKHNPSGMHHAKGVKTSRTSTRLGRIAKCDDQQTSRTSTKADWIAKCDNHKSQIVRKRGTSQDDHERRGDHFGKCAVSYARRFKKIAAKCGLGGGWLDIDRRPNETNA